MIKFENTEVVGFEHAIRGMRNPMNSWDKIDSGRCHHDLLRDCVTCIHSSSDYSACVCEFEIGENDLNLMKRLRKAGTDHRKYLRMINVYVDITAPLYWYKEFDTYKVGTVANSCSTMHKIHVKEFTLDDFSYEHLLGSCFESCSPDEMPDYYESNGDEVRYCAMSILGDVIHALNFYRNKFLETKDKKYWWQMIQLLPSSYNQKRTVMLNYETLNNIYKSRKNHKLDEWSVGFINWIKTLPYSEELICQKY